MNENEIKVELLPDNALPAPKTLAKLLDVIERGPDLDEDGRIKDGMWAGMTPQEVIAQRDAFNRALGS